MKTITPAQAEHQLTDLADQFEQGRQHRTYRFAPIPLPLWAQAIALTAVLPLTAVVKRLRLRGRDLQKRCAARHEGPGAEPMPSAQDCVEVPASSPWPRPAPTTEIELHRADGARLWMRSHEPQLPLATVVRTFLERL